MKKIKNYIVGFVIAMLIAFIYYYMTLPAINIHSKGFWFFISVVIIVVIGIILLRTLGKQGKIISGNGININLKDLLALRPIKFLSVLLLIILLIYGVGSILSSPFINAKKYQQLLRTNERNFTEDIKEVDFNTIPLLDKESAALLANRKMGSMVDMVSQFEVSSEYAQINYQDKPVRVAPLVYASPIKWLMNQSDGIPAYIMIDMTTQNTECVKLKEGIKYSKSEYFNRNLYRHLRFRYPTYIFDEQISFEIGEDGVPYWICPVKKFNIGLFGGQTIGNVIICNAITGECQNYQIDNIPQWVDKVFSAELLISLYDYSGTLKHGYWNSVLGQKDCLQSTNGYNYIALDDDVWVYTGVTSVNGDQSNVGFVLMNQRTMETRFYKIEGAIEDSAMSSAEGQVQNLGYRATFPILLNIASEPTYFMALKDDAGLVKKYAMLNVEKYQWVAIGDTIKECTKDYVQLLNTNGIISEKASDVKTISAKITSIAPVVLEGNTFYYVCVEGSDDIYVIDMSNTDLISIIKYQVGDQVTLGYKDALGLNPVVHINK